MKEKRPFAIFGTSIKGRGGTTFKFEDIFSVIRKVENELGVKVQLLNPEEIFGVLHLHIAFEKAKENFYKKINVAEDFTLEMLRVASGERQIKDALKKLGIKEKDRKFLIFIYCENKNLEAGDRESLFKSAKEIIFEELALQEEPEILPTAFLKKHAEEIKRKGLENLKKEIIEKMSVIDL